MPDFSQYFGYLYRFYVNNQEIVKKEDVNIPAPGYRLNAIDIGYGFSAVIADINFYRNFIVNPWGYVLGNKRSISKIYSILLNGKSADGECLPDLNIRIDRYEDIKKEKVAYHKILGVNCVGDFSPYLAGSTCSSNSFFDNTKFAIGDAPCSKCDSVCTGNCANETNLGCTCDFVSGDNALRIDEKTKKLKCEYLPYTDFAKLDKMTVNNIKVAKEKEYSMEFWFYIYTYTNSLFSFDGHEIIWDYHNKIRLLNTNNDLNVGCTPIFDDSNPQNYSNYEKTELISSGLFKWVYVTCSVNVNKRTFYSKKLYEYQIETPKDLIPDLSTKDNTKLIIQPIKGSRANYGFLFIKDIKLWSLYNIKRFETIC